MRHEHIQRFIKLVAVALMVAVDAYAQQQGKTESRRIVVSLTDRKLVLMEGQRALKTYDVAVGKAATPSPEGKFTVATQVANPTYYGFGQMVAPGPNNPVGTRWIGLSAKGYGIHGTNAPKSIGRAASHGCIRMRNKDVEELFTLVTIGAPVELHAAPLAQVVPQPAVVAVSAEIKTIPVKVLAGI